MADRQFKNNKTTLQYRPREIWCSFQPNGSDAPTLYSSGSKGVSSVARSAAGKYLVTLTDAYAKRGPVAVTVEHASDSTDLYGQFGGFGNLGTSTALTLTVKIKKGSTNTDIAAASTSWVHVYANLEDSSEA